MSIKEAQHADRILTHYITSALMNAGPIDGDTYSELDGLIQATVKPLLERIERLERRINELEQYHN